MLERAEESAIELDKASALCDTLIRSLYKNNEAPSMEVVALVESIGSYIDRSNGYLSDIQKDLLQILGELEQ
ncbi:MAG: hypothetical protein HUJ56_00250 [Erysipelotrichaceae bacterium]|nr:hypothetical protein [Erysipelotrichaceae bacterium]